MSDFVVKLVVLLVFCGGLIGYGVYSGRRTKSSSDFNLGDKSAPGWVVALSERAAGCAVFPLQETKARAMMSERISGSDFFSYASSLLAIEHNIQNMFV